MESTESSTAMEFSSFLHRGTLSRRATATEYGYVRVMHLLTGRHRIMARGRAGWPEADTIHERESM